MEMRVKEGNVNMILSLHFVMIAVLVRSGIDGNADRHGQNDFCLRQRKGGF